MTCLCAQEVSVAVVKRESNSNKERIFFIMISPFEGVWEYYSIFIREKQVVAESDLGFIFLRY